MKKIVALLVALILVVIAIGYMLRIPVSQKQIAVVTFVEHPVLNTIERAFRGHFERIIGTGDYKLSTTSAQGRIDNLPNLSRSIALQNPELIVTISTPVTQAMMREVGAEQKLVYTFVTNPDNLGDELTRTNSTGLSDAVNYSENLRIIREIFGDKVTIGMAYNPNEANSVYGVQQVEELLEGTGVKLVKASVTKEGDVAGVIRQLANAVDVIYVAGDNTTVGAIGAVLSSAYDKGIPVFASDSGSIEAGAIAGVSVDYEKLGRQTAEVVKRVLDGSEPREIPRVTLRGDKLIVNTAAAERIGFSVPDWLREEANELLENSAALGR